MRNRWLALVASCVAGGLIAAAPGAAQDPSETAPPGQKLHNNLRKAKEGSTAAPTVEQAKAFLDDAEKQLEELGVKQSRAWWVQENCITYDTEALAAASGGDFDPLRAWLA